MNCKYYSKEITRAVFNFVEWDACHSSGSPAHWKSSKNGGRVIPDKKRVNTNCINNGENYTFL